MPTPSRGYIETHEEQFVRVSCASCRNESLCLFRQRMIEILAGKVDLLKQRSSEEAPVIQEIAVTTCQLFEPA